MWMVHAYVCKFSLLEGIEGERFSPAELRVVGDEVDGMGHRVLGKDGLQVLCR